MSVATAIPEVASLQEARSVIAELFHKVQQLDWQVAQYKKQLFGTSSERQTESQFSKEQTLFSLFAEAAQPPATQGVVVPASEEKSEPRLCRQPEIRVLETVTERLEPIVREMKKELLAGDYAQVDETPVRVQDPDVQGKCATGWLWVLGKPGGDVIFEFHPGRGKEYALELLQGFNGYLQRDGYGVYGSLARDNPKLLPVGCWSHARRKFIDAIDAEQEHAELILDE